MGRLKYHDYGDDSDISESENEEYAQISRKRKRGFQYHDILKHATDFVLCCSSDKQTVKNKANHLALANYLKTDGTVCNVEDVDSFLEHDSDSDEMFVFPWVGIIVNISTGRSGPKLKDDLTASGFNPIKVKVIYDDMGHSGTALVEFGPNWSGFVHGLLFEKAYAADHHGKGDWKGNNEEKSGLYCWLARSDDYNSDNIIGENVRKYRDVKKISGLIEEQKRKQNTLLEELTNTAETKRFQVTEMENKVKTTEISYCRVFAEYNQLRKYYNEELEKLQSTAREHFQRILDDHEKFKLLAEFQKKELELRGKELERREAQMESERKKFLQDSSVVGPSNPLSDESDADVVDHEQLVERKLDRCMQKCEDSMLKCDEFARMHGEVLQLVREAHDILQMYARRVTPEIHEDTSGDVP